MYIQAKSEIKCVIFDLDGTLLDTLDDLHAGVNHALQAAGLPTRSKNEVRGFVGNGIKKLIQRAVPAYTPEDTTETVFSDFQAYYAIHCEDSTKPYTGIMKMLDELKHRGIKTAILSNKAQFAVTRLHQSFFADSISLALGESEAIKRKPDPSGILHAIHLLGVKNENTLYIGDSDVDITTCMNANVRCISVSWGFKEKDFLLEHGATDIIEVPDEIFRFL